MTKVVAAAEMAKAPNDLAGVVQIRNFKFLGLIPIFDQFQLPFEFSSMAVVQINGTETDNREGDSDKISVTQKLVVLHILVKFKKTYRRVRNKAFLKGEGGGNALGLVEAINNQIHFLLYSKNGDFCIKIDQK